MLQAIENVKLSTRPVKFKIIMILQVNVYLLTHNCILGYNVFSIKFHFQQYQTRFQTLWVENSTKTTIVKEFISKYSKLYDIRHVFDQLKSIVNVIDVEPSSLFIGPIDIKLGS